MNNETTERIRNVKERLLAERLFGETQDSLSVRVPGRDAFVLAFPNGNDVRTESFRTKALSAAGFHAAIYRTRKDAGAVLIGRTKWSTALSALGKVTPTLFDEQARHIGNAGKPLRIGRSARVSGAIKEGANVAIYGDQRICVGTTPNRVVFNAELFEKCSKAFVVAHASGKRIRKVPGWVRFIAGGRLKKDQKRAAESYAAGRIPEGMDGY